MARHLALGAVVAAVLAGGGPGVAADAGGALEVRVTYRGAPGIETVAVTRDIKACGPQARIETLLVGPDHGVANAVVWVEGAAGGGPGRGSGVLEQRGCELRPHVVAMTPGELEVRNSDTVLHSVRTDSTANPPITQALPRSGAVLKLRLDKPEIFRVTCDVHAWMLAWVAVMPSAFFGVTDVQGRVRIEDIPPGRHRVEVWHETLGTHRAEVEVQAGRTATVSIEMEDR